MKTKALNQENLKLRVIGLINKEKSMNTKRMNRLEELGRVDAEKGYTAKGKRNLKDEKKRVVGELKMKKGGAVKPAPNKGVAKLPKDVRNKMGYMKKGGKIKAYKKGGKIDGCAVKGHTRGRMV